MCQQWFSIAGLVLELGGFLLIAWEWRHVFKHAVFLRQNAVEEDYELTVEGDEAARARRLADASMWRNTQRENRKDNKRRAMMFYSGVALVVLGFVGQVIGSLPSSVSGLVSCQ
jgi:hypothetical protein